MPSQFMSLMRVLFWPWAEVLSCSPTPRHQGLAAQAMLVWRHVKVQLAHPQDLLLSAPQLKLPLRKCEPPSVPIMYSVLLKDPATRAGASWVQSCAQVCYHMRHSASRTRVALGPEPLCFSQFQMSMSHVLSQLGALLCW